jgi:DNA-binding transcriptional MerR regulator
MKIGDLAKAVGCQPVTIRFYERKGLLGNATRTESNYRVYGLEALERLAFIRNCRALGLTLQEIARLIAIQDHAGTPCHEVNDCLDKHLADARLQMQKLKLLEKDLTWLRNRCLNPGMSAECGVLSELAAKSQMVALRTRI